MYRFRQKPSIRRSSELGRKKRRFTHMDLGCWESDSKDWKFPGGRQA